MTVDILDLELSGLKVPRNLQNLRRHLHGKSEHHDSAFKSSYDYETIFYDCFHDDSSKSIILVGPPLLNFKELIMEAEFFLDGHEIEIKEIRDLSRCSVVVLDADEGHLLVITHRYFGGNIPVGRSFNSIFEGKNAIYSISLNNRLEWVQDWLSYNVREHGLESVVLSDNGSTLYSPKDLRSAIFEVAGLKHAVILRARYPFGPTGENKSAYNSLFLQRSLAELCRLRFFAKARAVLNTDIDELVYSRDGQSVFDAAVSSKNGYLRMDADWVYAQPPQAGKNIRHADHSYVSSTGRPKANRKWCVVPSGFYSGKQWLTHFIDNKQDPVDPTFRMWHFRQISTSWKVNRDASAPDLKPCPELEFAMKKVFACDV